MNPQVLIAGVGMVPFRHPRQSDPYDVMAEAAVHAALEDAQLDYELVDQAFASFVYADSCSGQRVLYRVGMTGIPIANVNNNCASASAALHLARTAVLSGEAESALAFGSRKCRPAR
jgi:acetyl-CoA C-acetyltransferase